VTAYRDGDRTVVLIPARFTGVQEREWVDRMVARLSAQDRRRRPPDADLMLRASELSRRYLDGVARPVSVSWVANQHSRWGSCTPADRTIRLSTRLRGMPSWVIDYVLVHELAHLIEQGHGPRFWALVESYPRTERARGYLEGFTAARDHRIGDDALGVVGEHDDGDTGPDDDPEGDGDEGDVLGEGGADAGQLEIEITDDAPDGPEDNSAVTG